MTYVGAAEGLKVGDFVHMAGFPGVSGRVVRVARDKTWVDVKWESWSKRILRPEQLVVEDAPVEVDLSSCPYYQGTWQMRERLHDRTLVHD